MAKMEQWVAYPKAHRDLQRTSGTIAEEGKNKLVNYPSQALTAGMWVNGNFKVDCANK